MKKSYLSFLMVVVLSMLWGVAVADTLCCLRFEDPVSAEGLEELLGQPVALEFDEAGYGRAVVPEAAMLYLKELNIAFEILWSRLDLPGSLFFDKADDVAYAANKSGFAINFRNHQDVVINHAPQNARVTSVWISLSGMAAYADLCTFSIISAQGTSYTLPSWYDEIWFDHSVGGIRAFNGQPVNGRWRLEGKGSNTAGERVDQWTIGVYYKIAPDDGNGDGDFPGQNPTTPVPNVYELIFAKAIRLITEAGLVVGPISYAYSDEVAEGQVIAVSPPFGAIVPEGAVVSITVSQGKKPDTPVIEGESDGPVEDDPGHEEEGSGQSGNFRVVPNCMRQPFAEAATLLRSEKLKVGKVTLEYHKTIPENAVIRQSPAPQSFVRPESEVHLVMSLGPEELFEVPPVVGKNVEEAETLLFDAEFQLGHFSYNTTAKQPFNEVVDQTPKGGAKMARHTAIDLVLSLGDEREREGYARLPNCSLRTVDEAKEDILTLGFTVGQIREEHDGTVPYGRVISQYPEGGVYLRKDTPIDLVISLGVVRETIVPSLIGLSAAEAVYTLQTSSFVVGTQVYVFDDVQPEEHVVSQDPAAGKWLKKGESVDLILSRGREFPEPGETEDEGEGEGERDTPSVDDDVEGEAIEEHEGETGIEAPEGEAVAGEGEDAGKDTARGCRGGQKVLSDYLLLSLALLVLGNIPFVSGRGPR